MIKRVIAFTLLLMMISVPVFAEQENAADSELPKNTAQSAVLMDAQTGRVLYEKNPDKKLPMASTTKIMTAILAIENGDLNSTVTVSDNASGTEGSSIWLGVGEKMKLSDMLYGLMLSSGNDAAVAIAEHIAGSVDKFVEMMNEKAKAIGAKNTHFVNPNGLPAKEHYTTAYDLALISCYAMKNETFRSIVGTETKEVTWEGHEYNRFLRNKNKILWQYEGGNGVKTGYTKEAGRCLSGAANKDGMQLVATVLNAPNMFPDCMNILDYGFEHYQAYQVVDQSQDLVSIPVVDGKQESTVAAPAEDICLPLTKDEYTMIEKRFYYDKLQAPVAENQVVGKIELWLGDKKMKEVSLLAKDPVSENTYLYNIRYLLGDWLKIGTS